MLYTIINLTRLGDLLQSQPLIKALKDSGKASKVSLICLDNFLDATDVIGELDHVAALSGSKLLHGLDLDWKVATQLIHTWIKDYLAEFPCDVVVNLTPSIAGKLFSNLIPAKEHHGFCLDESGFANDSSPWVTYTQAATLNRGCSPYNLVDCFLKILDFSGSPFSLKSPEKLLCDDVTKRLEAQALALQETFEPIPNDIATHEKIQGYVAFQLGASSKYRQWSIGSFAKLGKLLWEQEHILPILVGSRAEEVLAEEYMATKAPAINMCGKTNLKELAALLLQCRILVSNDTGTMHLAAGLKIPTIGIFLYTAQAWDTGPFQLNCICLEPRLDCHPCSFNTECPHDHKCISSIQPEALWEIVQAYLHKERWEDFYPIATQSARVWQTYFDTSGFMNLKCLSNDEKENRTVWIRYQRVFYKDLLDSLAVNVTDQANQVGECPTNNRDIYSSQSFFPLSSEFNDATKNILLHGIKLLQLIEEQAKLMLLNPSPKIRDNLISNVNRFSTLFSHNTAFTPLSILWNVFLQENAHTMQEMVHFFDILRKKMQDLYNTISHNPALV